MLKKLPAIGVKYLLFVIIITLFYGIVFCSTGFFNTPSTSLGDYIDLVSKWGYVVFSTGGLLLLISANRYLFAATFPPLTTLCTILAYFCYTSNVQLTPMIIEVTFINDVAIWMEVIDTWLVVFTLLGATASILVVVYRFKHVKLNIVQASSYAAVGLATIFYTHVWLSWYVPSLAARLPFNIYYSTKTYIEGQSIASEQRNTFTEPARTDIDSLTVVMVIGESLRPDHLQLNGYHRETTPLLMADSCISLPFVYTEPIYTHTSVPRMLTRADSINPDRALTEQSFITIFKQAGYHTSWISNQDQVETYVYFMKECDTLACVNTTNSVYLLNKWLDADIVPIYNEIVNQGEPKQLIVTHTIGSHWYYASHFDEETSKFKPNTPSKVISSNTQQEMINSYDNTIVETDKVIAQFIAQLKDRNAILIFLSDHGELLGEDGYYMKVVDRPEVHHTASFVWMSDDYKGRNPAKLQALIANKDKWWNTDFLFHSIIGAASIETVYKDDSLDIFETKNDTVAK